MQASSKAHACPCCGRTRTDHCRFDLDAAEPVVLCHNGINSGPPPNLRIGDTITFAGITWALIRTGVGHSGNSHLFRPHRPSTAATTRLRRRQKAIQAINDLDHLDQALADLDRLAVNVLALPPLDQLLDDDIRQARDEADHAHNTAKALVRRITRAVRVDQTLHPVLERLNGTQRDLRYQLADLDRYCVNPGKYWATFLVDRPAALLNPELTEPTVWESWNTYDPNYSPHDPFVAACYDAFCKQRGWR